MKAIKGMLLIIITTALTCMLAHMLIASSGEDPPLKKPGVEKPPSLPPRKVNRPPVREKTESETEKEPVVQGEPTAVGNDRRTLPDSTPGNVRTLSKSLPISRKARAQRRQQYRKRKRQVFRR